MVFLGPPGVGKTHLSVALAETAIQAGYGAYFMTAHDLVTDLARAYREGRLDRRMRVYLAPKVLIIDEMGYLPLDEMGATIFFQPNGSPQVHDAGDRKNSTMRSLFKPPSHTGAASDVNIAHPLVRGAPAGSEQMMTKPKFAELTGLPYRLCLHLIWTGQIPSEGRVGRVPAHALEEWIKCQTSGGRRTIAQCIEKEAYSRVPAL